MAGILLSESALLRWITSDTAVLHNVTNNLRTGAPPWWRPSGNLWHRSMRTSRRPFTANRRPTS